MIASGLTMDAERADSRGYGYSLEVAGSGASQETSNLSLIRNIYHPLVSGPENTSAKANASPYEQLGSTSEQTVLMDLSYEYNDLSLAAPEEKSVTIGYNMLPRTDVAYRETTDLTLQEFGHILPMFEQSVAWKGRLMANIVST